MRMTPEELTEEQEQDLLYKGRAFEASLSLNIAVQCLKNAEVWIADAAGEVEGYPVEYRILSLTDGLHDLMTAVEAEKKRLEGVKEE